MTVDDEIRTFPIDLESTRNGITVEAPWVQRQANGAVIARLHIHAPHHQAGELLLNDTDVVALDPDERPLRTQVRRVWNYATLDDVTPAHLETARFDVGFRLDLASSRGFCGLSIALLRTFNTKEGPRAVGGPWVFKFRVADDAEIAEALRQESVRQEAAREEAARQEAARQEAARLANERREQQMAERARQDAARAELPPRDPLSGETQRGEAQRSERRPGERLPRREWEAERERAAQLRAQAEARASESVSYGLPEQRDLEPQILRVPAPGRADEGEPAERAASSQPEGREAGGRPPRRRGGRFLRPEQSASERDDDLAAPSAELLTEAAIVAVPPEPVAVQAALGEGPVGGVEVSEPPAPRRPAPRRRAAASAEGSPEQPADAEAKPAARGRRPRAAASKTDADAATQGE